MQRLIQFRDGKPNADSAAGGGRPPDRASHPMTPSRAGSAPGVGAAARGGEDESVLAERDAIDAARAAREPTAHTPNARAHGPRAMGSTLQVLSRSRFAYDLGEFYL